MRLDELEAWAEAFDPEDPWSDTLFESAETPAWARRYHSSVRKIIAQGAILWPAAMQAAIDHGLRNSSRLADLAFFMHHPERNGRSIDPREPGADKLVALWKFLRGAAANLLRQNSATPKPAPAPTGGATPSGSSCKVVGQTVVCGTCRADGSNRPSADLPDSTVVVRPDLRRNKNRALRLRPDAEEAWARLVAAARADGIPAPYLTIHSALRPYDVQARLWRDRLTGVFRKMGCKEPQLSCIWKAADRTNKALKNRPAPHPKSAWLARFRVELRNGGCRIDCPGGGSDPAARAVSKLAAWTARPGRSKHQSGRAVDIHLGYGNSSGNVAKQRKTAAFRWLVCNAARFGFVPYVGEPWHWEFNG